MSQSLADTLSSQPALDTLAAPLSDAVRGTFKKAGPAGAAVKNALHGVWLGHPLHPVFTDIPIGAWTAALALDAKEAQSGDRAYGRAADFALGVGLLGALGAAVTGLNDWSETDGQPRRLGLLHGLLNISATACVATAYALRRSGERGPGRGLAALGYGIAIASSYLGGSLVYHDRIGVTHAVVNEPEAFTAVLDSDALAEGTMRKVTIEEASFLLVRQHGKVCALAHSCAHLAGPLSEGELKDGSVVCPWHGSEFSLADGHVINGPATQPQPCFEVRESNGRIELRAAR